MNKSKLKQRIQGMILIFLFTIIIFPAMTVRADDTICVKNGFKKTLVYSKYDKKYGYNFETDIPQNAKKCKVSSSKKSVATVENYGSGYFCLKPKKEGKTTVTVTGVVNGKTVKCKGTVRVVKFQQPFKTLKIDGKSYLKKLNASYNYLEIKTKKSKVKFSYKLQPGWKILESQVNDGKVKNGKTYSIGEEEPLQIYILLKNKKSGEEIMTIFYVYR